MLMNVNNTFGKCPTKTDALTVFSLGVGSDIKRGTHLFGVRMAELFLNIHFTAPQTEIVF